MFKLDTKLQKVLEKYECETIEDAIVNIRPKGYRAPTVIVSLADIGKYPDKTEVTLKGFIEKDYNIKPMGSSKFVFMIKTFVYKDGKRIGLQWIGKANTIKYYAHNLFKDIDYEKEYYIKGTISSFNGYNGQRIIYLDKITIQEEAKGIDTPSFYPEPIYTLKQKTKPHELKELFKAIIFEATQSNALDVMPKELEKELKVLSLQNSLLYMHGFKAIKVEDFLKFITYDKFLKRVLIEKVWQIIYSLSKQEGEKVVQFIKHNPKIEKEIIKDVQDRIGFKLTNDQVLAITKILSKFENHEGFKHLLFGDVGSGKTLVALIIAEYISKIGGKQVVIITPNSILSQQHFKEIKKIFPKTKSYFVSGKTTKKQREKIQEKINQGENCIVIGTTAINAFQFTNLGAVFIDEEQKMGVVAKEKLYNQAKEIPHLIYMTATPIPRTLAASAIDSNFQVVQINEKPAIQQDRDTMYIDNLSINHIYNIKSRMNKGEQTLIIVPSIKSEDMANIKETVEMYQHHFRGFEVGYIHGDLKKNDIDKTIQKYIDGEFPVLVATSMVDAGFSNSNITTVIVQGAERFGISQLHQMRGRCGRGSKKGFCYLIPSKSNIKEETQKRLNTLVNSDDGYELSKVDYSLRGSGDISSVEQSGLEVNLLNYVEEIEIMQKFIKQHKP